MDESNSLKSKVRVAVPWTLASASSRMVLSLLGTILLVRYLEPTQYGVWALLVALAAPVQLFVSFGFQHRISRFVPGLESHDEVASMVWPILLRRLGWTIVACGVVVAAFPFYAERLGLAAYHDHVVLYQLALIGNLGCLYISLSFSARFLQREVFFMAVPRQLVSITLTLVGIQRGEDLIYFVGLAAALASLNLIWCTGLFVHQFGWPGAGRVWRAGPESDETRSYRRASYVGDYGVTFLNTEVDRYLIALFSQSAEVAIYAVATTIVERLRSVLPSQLLRPLMEATFFRRYEETGQSDEIAKMFRLLWLIIASVCFLFVAIFAPLGKELLLVVFRAEYVAGYWIVLLYLVAMVTHQMPAGLMLKALKRADVLVYAQSAIFLNLLLGLLLVPRLGGLGMALATATSVTVKNGIMYLWARRLLDVKLPLVGLAKIVTAALGASGLVLLLKSWTALDDGVTIVLYGPVAVLAYGLALRTLSPLDADQKRMLVSAMPTRAAEPIRWVLG